MNDLLNETETAPILRVGIKTLQAWRQQSRGPRFVRVGRRVFYPRSEIDRYLNRRLVDTTESRDDEPAPEPVVKGRRGNKTAA